MSKFYTTKFVNKLPVDLGVVKCASNIYYNAQIRSNSDMLRDI